MAGTTQGSQTSLLMMNVTFERRPLRHRIYYVLKAERASALDLQKSSAKVPTSHSVCDIISGRSSARLDLGRGKKKKEKREKQAEDQFR